MTAKQSITLTVVTTVFFSLSTTSTLLAVEPNREQAKANFLQADVNQDRHLNFNEFTKFMNLNAEYGIGKAAMIKRFGLHRRAFLKLDANQDGVVSPQEFVSAQKNQ